MVERKSLKELSWDVSEEVYRADNALSYSRLAQFYKNGPKALISTEKVDTPSLRFGSLCDTILTAPEEFDDRFYVADISKFSDSIRLIVEMLSQGCPEAKSIDDCVEKYMIDTLNTVGYQSNWKDDTRIKKIKESGAEYFTVLKYSTGKIVISPWEFSEAQQCVQTLKTHPFTYKIFDCNEDEEIFYQLKFKADLFDIDVRCMFDIIKVNHKNKTIEPIDLKTSGHPEEDFEKSFINWNYWIQSGMYTVILRKAMILDDTFASYDLLPFKFIVINKQSLSPLVWSVGSHDAMQSEIKEKLGVTYLSLLKDADWHLKNGKFNYSRKSYENNGVNQIVLKL